MTTCMRLYACSSSTALVSTQTLRVNLLDAQMEILSSSSEQPSPGWRRALLERKTFKPPGLRLGPLAFSHRSEARRPQRHSSSCPLPTAAGARSAA